MSTASLAAPELSYAAERSLRDRRAWRTTQVSLAARAVNYTARLVSIPLALRLLGPAPYGLWLTAGSLIGWLSLADLGLGSGLVNAVAAAHGRSDTRAVRRLVSTALAASVVLALLLSGAVLLLSRTGFALRLLGVGAEASLATEAPRLIVLLGLLFAAAFALSPITNLCAALQEGYRAHAASIAAILAGLAALAVLWFTGASLTGFALAMGAPAVLATLLLAAHLFGGSHRALRPSLAAIDPASLGTIFFAGGPLFLVTLSDLAVVYSINLLAATSFGVAEVPRLAVPLAIYSVFINTCGGITQPYWPACVEAAARKDWSWIRGAAFLILRRNAAVMGVGALGTVLLGRAFLRCLGRTRRAAFASAAQRACLLCHRADVLLRDRRPADGPGLPEDPSRAACRRCARALVRLLAARAALRPHRAAHCRSRRLRSRSLARRGFRRARIPPAFPIPMTGRPTRILLVAPRVWDGGMESHLSNLALLYAAHGHAVTLAVHPRFPEHARRRERLAQSAVRLVRVPEAAGAPLPLRLFLRRAALARALAARSFDTVICHGFGLTLPWFRRFVAPGGRFFWHEHTDGARARIVAPGFHPPAASRYPWMFRRMFPSPHRRPGWLGSGRGKPAAHTGRNVPGSRGLPPLMAPGEIPRAFERDLGTGPLRISIFGALHPTKGTDALLRLWPSLSIGAATLHFHGPLAMPPIDALARELRVPAAFHGPYGSEEVPALMRATDLALIPSLHEGYPLTAWEAMAWGVPFVMTDVGAAPELTRENPNTRMAGLDPRSPSAAPSKNMWRPSAQAASRAPRSSSTRAAFSPPERPRARHLALIS